MIKDSNWWGLLRVGIIFLFCFRIIAPERLSFAFGLQYMSTKVLAHIPGPIIFGHLVDLNCVIWQKVCNKTGFCWIYDLGEQTKMIVTVVGTLSGRKSTENLFIIIITRTLPNKGQWKGSHLVTGSLHPGMATADIVHFRVLVGEGILPLIWILRNAHGANS